MVLSANEVIAAKMESAFSTMNDFERETVLRFIQALDEKFDVLAKETIEVHTILVSYFIYRSSLTYEN